MANICYDYFVGCTQPSPKGQAHVSQPKPKKTPVGGKGLRVGNQPLFILDEKEQLETHTRRNKPLRMDKGLSHQFFATLYLT